MAAPMPRSLGKRIFQAVRDPRRPPAAVEHGTAQCLNCPESITRSRSPTRKGGRRKQTEDALRQSLEDLTRMQELSTRLLQAGDFSLLLHDILDAAIAITGAQMGNIQLLEGVYTPDTDARGRVQGGLPQFSTSAAVSRSTKHARCWRASSSRPTMPSSARI